MYKVEGLRFEKNNKVRFQEKKNLSTFYHLPSAKLVTT